MSFSLENLCFAYDGHRVIDDVTLAFDPGKSIGIIGPNGSGKSTLLDLMAGHLAPGSGTVLIGKNPLSMYTGKALALKIAMVPQMFTVNFAYTAREVVMMGRYPHIPRFSAPADQDLEKVEEVMEKTGICGFENRLVTEVSGGERQRIFFARALAQNAENLLLDEATSSLDINHAVSMMNIVAKEVRELGKTVVSVFQDINLAAMYCDELVFLKQGRALAKGPVDEVLTEATVREVFGVSCDVAYHPGAGAPQVVYRKETV
ncbi:MAG: ABC transporter ATP-binding protein [Desulfarculaceae bacterium]|nr:ABC transporter ATP-binding protein [Desulfarculaceae bacterium]